MSLHTWYQQGPHKPSSCATFMLNSDRADRDQKKSCIYVHTVSLVTSNSL